MDRIPINSTALLARPGASPFVFDPVSGQYDWAYREEDAKRWAAHCDSCSWGDFLGSAPSSRARAGPGGA